MTAVGLAMSTMRVRQATVSSLCTWLVKRGHLTANPVAMLDRPPHPWRLKIALGFTVADIALCFVALPFARRIACSTLVTWSILALAVILGVICL